MPKLHIIYDPRDKISHNADLNRETGIKVAILDISNELGNNEIACYVEQLGTLLLEQVRMDDED